MWGNNELYNNPLNQKHPDNLLRERLHINSTSRSCRVLVDKTAMYDDKGFSVGCTQYHYGVAYAYKQEPDLLEYLKSLDLDLQLVYNAFSAQEQMRQHMGNFNFSF